MQNEDGGWGAFDHENNLQFLNHIPFADHNAMLDPSTADVTARAVECLGQMGWPAEHPVLQRARAFVRHEQSTDGSWFGRWGVNYIYGSSGVLRALETLGLSIRFRLPGRGEMAALGAESRRRLRRINSFLLRSRAERTRKEHRLANGLGHHWIARCGGA